MWQSQYPPNSLPTDITLSQFLSIQEKGVSAWSFEPDYESNPALIVQSRTEITFLADGVGMAEEEGGGCCVQSNLPLPKLNEVYYWECKFFEKPEATVVSIGLATKPFPSFRLPGTPSCDLFAVLARNADSNLIAQAGASTRSATFHRTGSRRTRTRSRRSRTGLR